MRKYKNDIKNDDVFLQCLTVKTSVNLDLASMDFQLQFSAVTNNFPFPTIYMRVTLYQVSTFPLHFSANSSHEKETSFPFATHTFFSIFKKIVHLRLSSKRGKTLMQEIYNVNIHSFIRSSAVQLVGSSAFFLSDVSKQYNFSDKFCT